MPLPGGASNPSGLLSPGPLQGAPSLTGKNFFNQPRASGFAGQPTPFFMHSMIGLNQPDNRLAMRPHPMFLQLLLRQMKGGRVA